MKYHSLSITHHGHDTFVIQNSKTVIFEPFELKEALPKADLIFITHEHHDHLSPEDIKKVSDPDKTIIISPLIGQEKLKGIPAKKFVFVKPHEELEEDGIKIKTIPSYNLDKFRSPGIPYHPKEDNHVGYIVSIDNQTFFHPGDSDFIEEMKNLGEIDVFFAPVSGIYTMSPDEAVEAVKTIRPKLAIPMHYGSVAGSLADAEEFKEKASNLTKVEII